MPLPGGPADKIGNRYETAWTISTLIDVMAEKAQSLRIEPPGFIGEGVEFILRRAERVEHHQVKRQQSGSDRWTLDALNRRGVLSTFRDKLAFEDNWCIFVSMLDAAELREMADRARASQSFQEFEGEFLKAKGWRLSFSMLHSSWGCASRGETWNHLRRVVTRCVDEQTLRKQTELLLDSLVEGEPAAVFASLADLCAESIHRELTAHDIWRHLQDKKHSRRMWHNDPHVLARVETQNQRYRGIAALLPGGVIEPRTETASVVQHLLATDSKRVVLLQGLAGSGKSLVAEGALRAVRDQGWPALAFRVDRLDPTLLPREVGKQLELPEAPAIVLASVANGRDCLLLIDQLDAVSLASGRHPDFLECIQEITKQTAAFPRMRVVLACREFDVTNDPRIRRISQAGDTAVVKVEPFTLEMVDRVTTRLGVGGLSLRQKEVLRLPQHLLLFSELVNSPGAAQHSFITAVDLNERFWEAKEAAVRRRLGRPTRWTAVIDLLCQRMSDSQSLSAPRVALDVFLDDAGAMVSEHVLVLENGRYSFFHESFFDYCFARGFARRGETLQGLLENDDQHLFRRAQVRQILHYERANAWDGYIRDITWLLSGAGVRAHLRQVAWALLSQVEDPSEEEWNVALAAANAVASTSTEDRMGDIEPDEELPAGQVSASGERTLRQTIGVQPAWFELLDRLGVIHEWLCSGDDRAADRAVLLISTAQKRYPDRVAELVSPFVNAGEGWRNRLIYLMQWSDLGASRSFLEIFLQLIDNGMLDDAVGPIATNADFWLLILDLPEKRPAFACEVIGHYLRRRLVLADGRGDTNPFAGEPPAVPDSQSDDRIVGDCATGAPATFVAEVLPFLLRVMERTAETQNKPAKDAVWRWRSWGSHYSMKDALLNGVDAALRKLAKDSPEEFCRAESLLRPQPYETAQFLLIRAYASGAEFADRAVEYLVEDTRRFSIGYLDCSLRPSKELLEAATPHCSDGAMARLEAVLLDLWPAGEQTRHWANYRGHQYQHKRLFAITLLDRRSAFVKLSPVYAT